MDHSQRRSPISGHDPELTYASSKSPNWPSAIWDFSPPQNPDRELISPVSSLSISQYQAKRMRRTHGSSDDSGDPESDGFVSKNFRVGGPYLCPYPAAFLPVPSTHPRCITDTADKCRIYTDINQILRGYNISQESTGFHGLQPIHRPFSSPVVTLVVIADRKKLDGSWIAAARSVYQLLMDKGFGDVSVEITDPRAFKRKTCSPVQLSDDIFPAWESVYKAILNTIDKHELIALECFRYGRSEDAMKNPPTVIISVQRDSQTDWKPVREQVVKVLDRLGFSHVAVCIMENQITRSVGSKGLLPDTGCQIKAQAGISLGINQMSSATGTLGGFLEIKLSGTDKWERMALTCFHCVYEGRVGNSEEETECLGHWKWHPVTIGDAGNASRILKMCQPSWYDVKNRIAEIDQVIAGIETPEFLKMEQDILNEEFILPFLLRDHRTKKKIVDQRKEQKANFKDFMEDGRIHLGHVFAGSGMYSAKRSTTTYGDERPTIRDWALIRVKPERLGDNKVDVYPNTPDILRGSVYYTAMHGGDMRTCGELYKAGRTTRFTSGSYGNLKSVFFHRKMEEGKEIQWETFEHNITGPPTGEWFSESGDSGAFIVDKGSKVVGLLFGGAERNNVSYFTHIDDVFDDIKMVTGAIDVRIMIPSVGEND